MIDVGVIKKIKIYIILFFYILCIIEIDKHGQFGSL